MTENNEHLALWGGRFTSGPSPELARLSKSTQFDWRLADDDIAGSRAHARALGRAGLLTADELQRMEDALDDAAAPRCRFRLRSPRSKTMRTRPPPWNAVCLQIAGDELGGKLRAGRSRNDQIACADPHVAAPPLPRHRRTAARPCRQRPDRAEPKRPAAP